MRPREQPERILVKRCIYKRLKLYYRNMIKRKIVNTFYSVVSKVANKKVVYIPNVHRDPSTTAVKSKYGFWYVGNVFDPSDVAYGIVCNGEVEEKETHLVRAIMNELGSSFVFYDIGSNTGWYTMLSAAHSKQVSVVSFEPVSEHTAPQKESIMLNKNESQVRLFEVALSDHESKESIRLAGLGSSLEKDFLEADFGVRQVDVKKLDTLFKEEDLKPPHFIKIDVEGHELKVLEGARSVLEAHSPLLFVEIAKTMSARKFLNKDYNALFELTTSLGYEAYFFSEDGLQKLDNKIVKDGAHMHLFLKIGVHDTLKAKLKPFFVTEKSSV